MKISVIDYGLGNLRSVIKAFEKVGVSACITDLPAQIVKADYLVLPGVGAFRDGIEGIRAKGLLDAIVKFVNAGRPMLGICLGMQLMMTESEEFGRSCGLDLIPGKVVSLKSPKEVNEDGYKVPHIGWNGLFIPGQRADTGEGNVHRWRDTILSDTQSGTEVYFVHSYVVKPDDSEHVIATTVYGGQELCAVMQKGNMIGCQFHPERSGPVGLDMLRRFTSL